MEMLVAVLASLSRRPPRGGRGLKSGIIKVHTLHQRSSPSRGTWIEMQLFLKRVRRRFVVPLAGDVD